LRAASEYNYATAYGRNHNTMPIAAALQPLPTNAARAARRQWSAFITGLALSASLIVAIGAQNAFVLRQGLRREHVLAIVVFYAIADFVLAAAFTF
jgi:hypothetical protein